MAASSDHRADASLVDDAARAAPFDVALLRRRRRRGRFAPDFLEELAGEELLARLADLLAAEAAGDAGERVPVMTEDVAAPVLVTGPAWLAARVGQVLPQARVVRADWLAPRGGEESAGGGVKTVVLEDHARLPFADDSFGLVMHLFDLALVNDLPGALMELRRVLRSGAPLLLAMPGGETLRELRAAWRAAELAQAPGREPGWRVAPFMDMRKLAQMAGMAGLRAVVTDVERLTVRHADALRLMAELRAFGWSNPLRARPRVPVSRTLLARAAAHYETHFADDDGRVRATFELVYLSARAG